MQKGFRALAQSIYAAYKRLDTFRLDDKGAGTAAHRIDQSAVWAKALGLFLITCPLAKASGNSKELVAIQKELVAIQKEKN